ncbi:MAG: hypothetical protein KDK36_14080, partial [Leptospiraceae bacterium]|nr:hypothetical protein [Leptospiraceae bacterium]
MQLLKIFKILVLYFFLSLKIIFADAVKLTEEEKKWIELNKSKITIGLNEYPPLLFKNLEKPNEYEGLSVQY